VTTLCVAEGSAVEALVILAFNAGYVASANHLVVDEVRSQVTARLLSLCKGLDWGELGQPVRDSSGFELAAEEIAAFMEAG
jgi:hypothetical protein